MSFRMKNKVKGISWFKPFKGLFDFNIDIVTELNVLNLREIYHLLFKKKKLNPIYYVYLSCVPFTFFKNRSGKRVFEKNAAPILYVAGIEVNVVAVSLSVCVFVYPSVLMYQII